MSVATNVTLLVPGQLRQYCSGVPSLSMTAASVRAALDRLEEMHPMLYRGVCDETRTVRRHINIFVNTANVRDGQGLDTPLAEGDVVTILPAVSGG